MMEAVCCDNVKIEKLFLDSNVKMLFQEGKPIGEVKFLSLLWCA